jgi:hypothetical protein
MDKIRGWMLDPPKGGLEIRVDVQNVSADLQESVCVAICFVMLHLRITTKH